MATYVERVVHRVAHAEGLLNGGELRRGEAGAQVSGHARQEAGDEGDQGSKLGRDGKDHPASDDRPHILTSSAEARASA